ncbi:MAG TPA: TRAP transporter substrate-binding protein [Rhizobiales bacterium]|nr:TRAP transporter substrate-binding protein [Hyphomicrobiales bacterium]
MIRILLFVFAVAIGSAGVSSARAEPIVLRVHHFLGADSIPHRLVLTPWARRVEKQSGGRIKVEIYPDMSLGGRAPDLVGQVQSGIIDIVWTAAAYTPGLYPRTEVFALPLVHKGDAVATNLAIKEMYPYELEREFVDVHPLLIHVHQGHALHMMTPVSGLGDLEGKVIRPPGRRVGRWTVEALGAQITKKRHPKLAKAMKAGQLDGALMSFHLARSMGVADVAQTHMLLGKNQFFGTSLYLFLMNRERYEALPGELRDVIDRNSGPAFAREVGKVYQKAGDEAMAAVKAAGHRIVTLDPAKFNAVRLSMLEVLRSWSKDLEARHIDGLQLIKKARILIRKNSKTGK